MTNLEHINQLTQERSRLYRLQDGPRRNPAFRSLIAKISGELEALWNRRRQERAGRREGIDLLIERSYERAYGPGFDDAVSPVTVESDDDVGTVTLAA